MNRKSMGEIISKLLLFKDEGEENFPKKKMELLSRVLEELKWAKEQEKYECICSMLEGAFYNKNFVSDFMNEQKFINILYNILEESKDKPKKLIAIMKLLIRINENVLKNIEGRCTPVLEQENPMEIINMFSNNYTLEETNKEIVPEMEQTIKNVILNLINCIEKNKFIFLDDLDDYSSKENSEFKTTYQIPQRKLGMMKLAQIELFRTILDILVNAYAKYNMKETLKIIQIIKEKKLFPKINKLFFDFPFCNIYQAYYNQIIEIVINELSPEFLIETVFGEKTEKDEKDLIQTLIDKSLNNFEFKFISDNIAFDPNYAFEVTLLAKIFASKNEHLKKIINSNKNLEIFNKVIGEEINNIFEQKLLLNDNDIQFNSNAQEDTEEKKPNVFFGQKNFMELLKEDIDIYQLYLQGGDYEKALNEKKEKERIEREEMEKKEMEEKKKSEEDEYFNNEEEDQEDNKKSDDLNNQQNDKDEDKKDEKDNENDNEKDNEIDKDNAGTEKEEKDEEKKDNEEKEKEKVEENKEESSTEENEETKQFNDANFWKAEIVPDDNILSAVMKDFD